VEVDEMDVKNFLYLILPIEHDTEIIISPSQQRWTINRNSLLNFL